MPTIQEPGYTGLAKVLLERALKRDEEVDILLAHPGPDEIEGRVKACRNAISKALVREYPRTGRPARMVRELPKAGYRIACYMLEGTAGYNLPVNLYLPDGPAEAKHPAVLVPVGHWPRGKADENTQQLCASLALHGIVAATFDPIGQGERCTMTAEGYRKAHPQLPLDMMAVNMHTIPGNLFYLLGENLGSLFVWEARQVCDLLCMLDSVDSERIGVTGQSGGGTQSLYLAALDERIKACSPVQCLTKLAGHVAASGVGDCEQSILELCTNECFDYADFLWALYPKHLMISAARDDFFTLAGAELLDLEMQKLYSRLPGRYHGLKVAEGGHTMGPESIRFALDFFCDVYGLAPAVRQTQIEILPPGALACMDKPARDCSAVILANNIYTRHARRIKQQPKDTALDAAIVSLLAPKRLDALPLSVMQTDDGFILRAGFAEAWCREGGTAGTDEALLIILGGLPLGPMPHWPGPLLWMDPLAVGRAVEKLEPCYDAETRLFNLGAMMGYAPAVVRCHLVSCVLDHLDTLGRLAGGVTLAGHGLSGLQALYTAVVETRIDRVVLDGLPRSFDAWFGGGAAPLPETLIVPGLATLTSLQGLARQAKAEVVWPGEGQIPTPSDKRILEQLSYTAPAVPNEV